MTTTTRQYTDEQLDSIAQWNAAYGLYEIELRTGNRDTLLAAERLIVSACERVASTFYPEEVCDVAA
jgi:hypothetical protein